jgi:hypothetical protein
MSKLPKAIGTVLILVAVAITGLEHQRFAPGLFGITGTTTALSPTNETYQGMPAVDFNWYY